MSPDYLSDQNFHNVSPEHLHSQLEKLKRTKTSVLLDEFAAHLKSGKAINKLFTVSFDDGYASVKNNALPILRDLEIPCTVFLNSGFQERLFWRDGIRIIIRYELVNDFVTWVSENAELKLPNENALFYKMTKKMGQSENIAALVDRYLMRKAPELYRRAKQEFVQTKDWPQSEWVSVGNHTLDHFVLSDLSRNKQAEQIEINHENLVREGYRVSTCFSIPFGNRASFNQHTFDIAYEMGYKAILVSSGLQIADSSVELRDIETHGMSIINRFMPDNTPKINLNKVR